MDSLSLKLASAVSLITVTGWDHVRPPSVDRLTRTPFVALAKLNVSAIAYAVPRGPKVTHGSEARSYSPPVHFVSPGTGTWRHVRPSSYVTPVTRPRAPPSFQRSCCHSPTRLPLRAGFAARFGSTSAPTQ